MAVIDDYASNTTTTGKLVTPKFNQPSSIKGVIETQGDHDWIAISLTAGEHYNFSFNGFTPLIRDATGKLYAYGADVVSEKTGTYYVDVAFSANNIGNYNLIVRNMDDYAGNTTATESIKAPAFGRINGSVDFVGDSDWIKVNLSASNSYYIVDEGAMILNEEGGTFSGIVWDDDVSVLLRDANGQVIADLIGESISNTFRPSKSGVYYLDVSGEIFEGKNTYDLNFFSYKDDFGNSMTTAQPLRMPTINRSISVSGLIEELTFSTSHLEQKSDSDWFSLALKQGEAYRFNTTGLFDLVNAKNDVIISSTNSIEFTVPTSGTYYLVSHDSDKYRIDITQLPTTNGTERNDVLKGNAKNNILNGYAGNDTLNGGAGNDQLNGNIGKDILNGDSGNDRLNGSHGDDLLRGGLGNDRLNGGQGKDTMMGGVGNDFYYVNNIDDIVRETEKSPKQIDSIFTTVSYILPANVENLTVQNEINSAVTIQGNRLNNILHNSSENFSVTLIGGLGKDTYNLSGDNIIKIARGESLPNQFDVVNFDFVDDVDNLKFNLPNAHIAVDLASGNGKNVGSIHSHHISHGIISFDNLETYQTPLTVTANNIAQVIGYLQTNNQKLGDVVAFVSESDTYLFQEGGAKDTLVKINNIAAERVNQLSDHNIDLKSYLDDYGNSLNTAKPLAVPELNLATKITGKLNGFGDQDYFSLSLKAGITYKLQFTLAADDLLEILDAKGQRMEIFTTQPSDYLTIDPTQSGKYYLELGRFFSDSRVSSYDISISQFATRHGTPQNDTLKGTVADDALYGDKGNDTLNGAAGNDLLNGSVGSDTMHGGIGNDRYYIDNIHDKVVETSKNPTEIDTVYSNIGYYSLPANVENVVLQKHTGSTAFVKGNTLNNRMVADDYNFVLSGEAGNDTLVSHGPGTLIGGAGKDTYVLSSKGGDDIVKIDQGDSLPNNFDVIHDFVVPQFFSEAFPVLFNTLDLPSNRIATAVNSVNGKNVGVIRSHSIQDGLISFDNQDIFTEGLNITARDVATVIKYLQTNITHLGDTVVFVAGQDGYVFQEGGKLDTLVQLVGASTDALLSNISGGDGFIHLI